jgi:hypothetical protein
MKCGKYLERSIGFQNRGKRSVRPALQCLSRYALLAWLYVAIVAALRLGVLCRPVVHVGGSLRPGTLGEVCFPMSVAAYVAQAVLGSRQW